MNQLTTWMWKLLNGWKISYWIFQGSIVFISHDRSFIRKMATRIVDLDRGQLQSYLEAITIYI